MIVSARAPIGYVAQTSRTTAFNQGCRGLIPTDQADTRYFRYQILSMTDDLQGRGQGSTFAELSSDALASTTIFLPRLDVQRAIAAFLERETARIGTLIAAKRRMMALVDERWLSRLRFLLEVNHPEWVPLKSVADYREGPGILAVDFRDEGTPLLRIGNLIDDTIRLEGCGFLDPADVAARWAHLRVRTGELLVSGSATSGVPVLVPPQADGAVPYTGLIRLWPST